jgi:dihydrofolate reductase
LIEPLRMSSSQIGKDILVFGGRTLWNELLADGLVDELPLMIGPVVLGAGTPAFGGRPAGPFRLATREDAFRVAFSILYCRVSSVFPHGHGTFSPVRHRDPVGEPGPR